VDVELRDGHTFLTYYFSGFDDEAIGRNELFDSFHQVLQRSAAVHSSILLGRGVSLKS